MPESYSLLHCAEVWPSKHNFNTIEHLQEEEIASGSGLTQAWQLGRMGPPGASGRKLQGRFGVNPKDLGAWDEEHLKPTPQTRDTGSVWRGASCFGSGWCCSTAPPGTPAAVVEELFQEN